MDFAEELNTAINLHQQGQYEQAKQRYKQLLQYYNSPDVDYLLGLLYNQTNQFKAAIFHLERCAAKNVDNPHWHNALALSYQNIGHYNTAIIFSSNALEYDQNNPTFLNEFISILIAQKNYEAAIQAAANFNNHQALTPGIWLSLAKAYRLSNRPLKATRILLEAHRCFPDNKKICFNLAESLFNVQRYQLSKQIFSDLLNMEFRPAECLSQLSMIEREQGNFASALQLLQQANSISPNTPAILWNLSLQLLQCGDYTAGWKIYDSGLQAGERLKLPNNIELWQGQALDKQSLLLIGEQGLGDQIMFASHLSALTQLEVNLTLSCDTRIVNVLKQAFPTVNIVSTESLTPGFIKAFDYVLPEASLYPLLEKIAFPFSPKSAYLKPRNPVKLEDSNRFALKVGFAWKGGSTQKYQKKRSIPLRLWENIFHIPGIRFQCLQHFTTTKEKSILSSKDNLYVSSDIDNNQDIEQLLDLIFAQDIIITVDNTIAHLASALGKPTWCLIPFSPDWRWGTRGTAPIWYQTMILFRQGELHNWHDVLNKIEDKLLLRLK